MGDIEFKIQNNEKKRNSSITEYTDYEQVQNSSINWNTQIFFVLLKEFRLRAVSYKSLDMFTYRFYQIPGKSM